MPQLQYIDIQVGESPNNKYLLLQLLEVIDLFWAFYVAHDLLLGIPDFTLKLVIKVLPTYIYDIVIFNLIDWQ